MNDKMIPRADPASPETRLLRAIYGLCPDCDITDPHEHLLLPCGHPVKNADGSFHVHQRFAYRLCEQNNGLDTWDW